MRNVKNKTTIAAIIVILMLTFSTVGMISTVAGQKITATAQYAAYGRIGINSPTRIAYRFSQNLLSSPAFLGKTSVMADATMTFHKPDGTTDVVNGPFKMRPDAVQGRVPDIMEIYTPDQMGNWAVDFYWPGDSTYEAITKTGDIFEVGVHFPPRESKAVISLTPYPNVGLGQDLLLNAWVTPPPYDAWDFYENYTFTFASPSGTSFVVGPMNSEQPGTVWFNLPLTEIGEWSITFDFPGNYMYEPDSETRTITVQEDVVPVGYPDTPLPTEPWTFPINTQNREWRNIAGPWYQPGYNASHGAWNPYTEAPKTAHILWKLPSYSQLGGYIGSPHSIETGGGREEYGGGDTGIYESYPIQIKTIMAGRGYAEYGGMIHCYDIRTGEELWAVEGGFDVGTERGDDAVLYDFSSQFRAYDAISGAKILDVEGLNGFNFYEPPYVYRETSDQQLIKWTTDGNTGTFADRVVWNVTGPYIAGTAFTRYSYSQIIDGVWVAVGIFDEGPDQQVTVDQKEIIAYNTTTGELVYRKLVSDQSDPTTWINKQGPMSGSGYGLWYHAVVNLASNEGRGWVAFDVATGERAWFSEAADYPWGGFWAYNYEASAYDQIIAIGYSGVYGIDAATGEINWHYIAEDPYYETPYGSNIAPDGSSYSGYQFGSVGPIVGGGVVYAPTTEHGPTLVYRGQALHAIDAFTGEKLWDILGYYRPDAIASGVMVARENYNGFTYAFGKGESETTVSTSTKIVTKGSSILLEGTVLDLSPAQAGTAAIADASQTEWMEYLHMQQPCPAGANRPGGVDVKGVDVTLSTNDPNGNFYEIGTATANSDGKYAITWTPPVEGTYEIIATFKGSEAYYASYATTHLGVELTPTLASLMELTPTEPTPTEPTETAFITTELAILAAVAIAVVIGAVSLYMLKRRK